MLQLEINPLIHLFLHLVKIDGLSGNEKPVADFIKHFLTQRGYSVIEDNSYSVTGSNTGNVICKVGNGGELALFCHMDTARSTKDVIPVIRENMITSSGNTVLGVDNRAGIAILLHLLDEIAKQKISVRDFTVAFTTCEETTLSGSLNINLNGMIKRGFVFDSGYRPGKFISTACGSIAFEVKIIGRASHSGIAPEKGINALQIASKAISRLPLGRIDEDTTMNIGKLVSGTSVNVIPELVHLEGEVRSFNIPKAEKYFNNLAEIFKEESDALGARLELSKHWDFLPYSISPNSEVYNEIISAIKAVGLEPHPVVSLGGSDANSLNGRGIQSVNIGIGAQNPHGDDEFILIEDLVKSVQIAFELVRKN